jgi:hypothetical protein
VAKLVARLLATAALWVRIQTSQKYKMNNNQRNGQNNLARQEKKIIFSRRAYNLSMLF